MNHEEKCKALENDTTLMANQKFAEYVLTTVQPAIWNLAIQFQHARIALSPGVQKVDIEEYCHHSGDTPEEIKRRRDDFDRAALRVRTLFDEAIVKVWKRERAQIPPPSPEAGSDF